MGGGFCRQASRFYAGILTDCKKNWGRMAAKWSFIRWFMSFKTDSENYFFLKSAHSKIPAPMTSPPLIRHTLAAVRLPRPAR